MNSNETKAGISPVLSTAGLAGASDQHYRIEYKGVKLDPYRICKVYQITDPAHQHALKKLLRAGKSIKPLRRDIEEVQMALTRMLEMLDEDNATANAIAQGGEPLRGEASPGATGSAAGDNGERE